MQRARRRHTLSHANTPTAGHSRIAPLPHRLPQVSGGYRPPRPGRISDAAWALIESCWAHDPCERPTMAQAVERLQDIGGQLQEEKAARKGRDKGQRGGGSGGDDAAATAGCSCVVC